MPDDEYFEVQPCVNTDDKNRGWAGKHPAASWNPLAGEWQCHYCREDWTTRWEKGQSEEVVA